MVARILQNAGNEPTILKVITVQLILFVPYIVMKMRYCVQKAMIREGVKGNAFACHEEQMLMATYVMAVVHPYALRVKFWFPGEEVGKRIVETSWIVVFLAGVMGFGTLGRGSLGRNT